MHMSAKYEVTGSTSCLRGHRTRAAGYQGRSGRTALIGARSVIKEHTVLLVTIQ